MTHELTRSFVIWNAPPGTGQVLIRVENLDSQSATSPEPFHYLPVGPVFVRGDVNADGGIDIADAIAVLDLLFANGSLPCHKAADANDDGGLDVADAVAVLFHLFGGGESLPPPADCGQDPTEDSLTCESYPRCL